MVRANRRKVRIIFKTVVGVAAVALILGVSVYLWDRQQAIRAAEDARQAELCLGAADDFSALKARFASPSEDEVRASIRRVQECGYELTEADRRHPNILPTLDPEAARLEAQRLLEEQERDAAERRCSNAIGEVNIAATGRSPVMGNMIVAIKTARECGMSIPQSVLDRYE